MTNGQVTNLNDCQGVQPSTFAASSGSRGIESIPLESESAKHGGRRPDLRHQDREDARRPSISQGNRGLRDPQGLDGVVDQPNIVVNMNLN